MAFSLTFQVNLVAVLLIYPPLAKPCEPPAGIARLAGFLQGNDVSCQLVDANLEGILFLLEQGGIDVDDTWTKRARRNLSANLAAMRSARLYDNRDRYHRAVSDLNRVLEQIGKGHGLALSLANYQDSDHSPLRSEDLLKEAAHPEANIFFPYFKARLEQLLIAGDTRLLGFSLNYLSQANTTFAMIGFVKEHFPDIAIVLGGGLVTSWMRNPDWHNPFAEVVDHLIAGPGEEALLALAGKEADAGYHCPNYQGLPLEGYLAPGGILPYAASSGCYWNKCSFCPEKAEGNPYHAVPPDVVVADVAHLVNKHQPALLHFLDNAVSPALMEKLIGQAPGVDWYGFARVSQHLTDPDFCRALRKSGCLMLKLGLESGDQGVLDAMDKGIDVALVSKALLALKAAGIATYVYLLFGTPSETVTEARRTLEFTARHYQEITFLNLAIFNLPLASPEAAELVVDDFYEGDLSLYREFVHPRGWNRGEIRKFLSREFKRHPKITPIIQRDPLIFTSNHAAFFCQAAE